MDYVALWFVLLGGGGGYIAPLNVHAGDPVLTCGIAGEVHGVTFDRETNPTTVYWPDPQVAGAHCHVDVTGAIAALPAGEYEFATTEFAKAGGGPYHGIDPHTSTRWIRAKGGEPKAPANVRAKE